MAGPSWARGSIVDAVNMTVTPLPAAGVGAGFDPWASRNTPTITITTATAAAVAR